MKQKSILLILLYKPLNKSQRNIAFNVPPVLLLLESPIHYQHLIKCDIDDWDLLTSVYPVFNLFTQTKKAPKCVVISAQRYENASRA